MSAKALKHIKKCLETKDTYLDLGRCGLSDKDFYEGTPLDKALRLCTHLQTFILSSEWAEFSYTKSTESKNSGKNNYFNTHPPAILKLSALKKLILQGDFEEKRGLTDMSFVAEFKDLEELYLSNNKIEKISGLSQLRNLKALYIWRNNIADISGLEGLTSLKKLDLWKNRINHLKGLEDLICLDELNISNNQIKEIKGFDNLNSLGILHLRSNQIQEIKGLDNLSSLSSLHIAGNEIQEIKGLDNLGSLSKLDLSSNQIQEIKGLDNLGSLSKLDLSSNQIQETKGLDKLGSLSTLSLRYNKIREIKGLDNLNSLNTLDLGSNEIQEIKGLDNLNSLNTLDLRSNKIQEIKGLDNLSSLKTLALGSNQIQEIKGLDNLILLKKLEIQNNSIENIKPLISFFERKIKPLGIVFLEGFQGNEDYQINLSDNPLRIPPIEIAQQGTEAILDYFKQLEQQGTEYLYEAKMLIVGQPRAGKTSLRTKLFNVSSELPTEDKTTRGIDIQRLDFAVKDTEGKQRTFYYNVWDFGGQQIYQTTHQFFLTHRSLYVLVMDTGKDSIGNDDDTINYWLQTVELLGGGSPLLLVGNEKNDRKINIDIPPKRARFGFLKSDYGLNLDGLIKGTAFFNPDQLKKFELLKQDIEKELNGLPLVGFPMPKNWVQVRNELQVLSGDNHYITKKDFIEVCKKHDIVDYVRQMELSRIFHDLGVFLHFQAFPNLEDFIILQNTWATDAVFAVLDNEEVRNNKGRFTDAELPRIWKDKQYEPEVHSKLLYLMMQFELCYQVEKSKAGTYIIPELLSDTSPNGCPWEPQDDLPLMYRYDFMPKGILTRLIVRMHRRISIYQGEQVVWKTGVKVDGNRLECPKTEAEITEAWNNKQLDVRVHGPFAKELMSKITYEIDKLNDEYFRQVSNDEQTQKSRWHKMIPCNCNTCQKTDNKHFYKYDDLLKRKAFGKDTIECEKEPFATVNISELLEGVFSKKTEKEKSPKAVYKSKKIFISYSKDDLDLINTFIKHLSALQRDGVVSHWCCTELNAASKWDEEIQYHLDQSDIACFMVSPNFMKTDYIHEHEIKKAFERNAKDKNFKIVPIVLDFCKWTTHDNNLGDFTALPYTAKPVVDFKNQNMAWYIIEECLRLMIEKDLNPTGDDFYSRQALPKDVLKIYERIVAGKADA